MLIEEVMRTLQRLEAENARNRDAILEIATELEYAALPIHSGVLGRIRAIIYHTGKTPKQPTTRVSAGAEGAHINFKQLASLSDLRERCGSEDHNDGGDAVSEQQTWYVIKMNGRYITTHPPGTPQLYPTREAAEAQLSAFPCDDPMRVVQVRFEEATP